jgi:hypothetical protein
VSIAVGLVIAIVGSLALLFCLMLLAHRRRLANEDGKQRESRGLRKLEPFFRREIVEAKVRASFPNIAPSEILQLLDKDLPTVWGLERLQLAILKLSNCDLDQLHYYLDSAERDVFTIVGLAEYPEASHMGREYLNLTNPEQEVIHQRDQRQYLNWLKKR